jgi:hypothetical protein
MGASPLRTVRVQGGVGNQLFCLAFARSLALLTGEQVGLDTGSYGADRYGNDFHLRDLAARIGGLSPARHPIRANRFTSALLRRLPAGIGGHIAEPIDEPGPATLADLARRQGYFDGYWQNEAYIHEPVGLAGLVRRFVGDRAEPGGRPPEVAVHFRTYKEENHPVRSRTPDRDYFARAIAAVEARLGPVGRLELISDDPELALRRLGDVGREVVARPGASAWDDLSTIMDATALILTNSSFSWWGGFCGRATAVIYPRRDELFHYPAPAARFDCV